MIPVDGKAGPADVCVIELGGTIGILTTAYFTCGSTSLFSVFKG
jgi:CTP synthase (UTP-ammonia lyase)